MSDLWKIDDEFCSSPTGFWMGVDAERARIVAKLRDSVRKRMVVGPRGNVRPWRKK